MNRGFLSKQNLAIIFGVALVLTVVIVAAAVGIGHPSVPSDDVAVVDDSSINIPGVVDKGHISKAGFDRLLLQTAKQSGLQAAPQPSDPNYKQLKDQTMGTALDMAWITGEAEKQGVTSTDTQVSQALQQIKSQFKTQAEYVKARDQAGLTDADVLERARLQAISNAIQSKISDSVGTPSDSDAQEYYDVNKSQFEQPEQRTIRIVQNQDAHSIDLAYQALRTDDSPANWKKVAAQYSTDPTSKDKGGLRTDVVKGSFQQPLDSDIFEAPLHQVQGPVATSTGNFIFEVESVKPATTQSFAALKDQLKQQIKTQNQQNAFSSFLSDYRDYWTGLTTCGSDYTIDRCNNFSGNPNPCPDPTLSAAQQQQQLQQQGCPPPVLSNSPVAPGSIKPFAAASAGQPQKPHPAGAAAAAPTSPTGLSGAIPGASGTSPAPGQ